MTQTYYSPFFPNPDTDGGTKGSTVPIVTPGEIVDIKDDITDIKDRVDTLEAGGAGDFDPPAAVTGLALSSLVYLEADGSQRVGLTATWDASAATDLNFYELAIQENSGTFVEFTTGKTSTQYNWTVRAGQSFGVRIRAVDNSGNRSSWSSVVTITSATDTIPPGSVTSPSILAGVNSLYLSWTNPSDADLSGVEIYENTVNNSGTATLIAIVNAEPTKTGGFSRTGITTAATRYYWMKARDTSGNLSGFSTVVSAAPSLITGSDIQNNTIISSKIADLDATKLTGQIVSTQITDSAITTPKIATNSIVSTHISALAVTTEKMAIAAGNLIPNGDFSSGDKTNWSPYSNPSFFYVVPNTEAGMPDASNVPTKYVGKFQYTGGAANSSVFTHAKAYTAPGAENDGISVQPGEQYYISLKAAKNASFAATSLMVYIYYYKQDGTISTAYTGIPSMSLNTTWTTYSGSFTVPTGAVRCWAYVYVASMTAGAVYWTSLRVWRKSGGELIVDGAITSDKIAANTITAGQIAAGTLTAAQIAAGSLTGDRFSTSTSLPGTITVGSTGVSIGTIQTKVYDGLVYSDTRSVNSPPSYYQAKGTGITAEFKTNSVIGLANTGAGPGLFSKLVTEVHYIDFSGGPVFQQATDAAGRIWTRESTSSSAWTSWKDMGSQVNAGTTLITPGKIQISGSTTLSDWRNGGDTTKIEGGSIAANTVTANKLSIGNRNITVQEITFEVIGSTIYWTHGYIVYVNDSGATDFREIPAGSASYNPAGVYIYWVKDSSSLTAGVYNSPNYDTSIVLAVWHGGTNLIANYGGTIIDGNRITTGTVTADRLNVATLSAITANIGLLRTATTGARVEIENNQIRVYDSANTLRVRLGVW